MKKILLLILIFANIALGINEASGRNKSFFLFKKMPSTSSENWVLKVLFKNHNNNVQSPFLNATKGLQRSPLGRLCLSLSWASKKVNSPKYW